MGALLCIPAQAFTNILSSVYDNTRDIKEIINFSVIHLHLYVSALQESVSCLAI
jgi:hypothetical protein